MREGRGAAPAVLLGVLAMVAAGSAAAVDLDGGVVPEGPARLVREVPSDVPRPGTSPEPKVPGAPDVVDRPLPAARPSDVVDDAELPAEAQPLVPLLEDAEARVQPVARQVGLVPRESLEGGAEAQDFEPATAEEHAPHWPQSLRPDRTPGLAESAAAVSALAVLGGALAYFWPALKYAAAPLYSRIAKDHVLVHGTREGIYRLVKENPGIHAHQVAERLDLAWGTAVHHLKLLEQNGLLVAHRDGRYKRFFIAGEPTLPHKEAVALLRNDTSRRIAETVAGTPGLIQKDVCKALGVSSSLATWHLQRLAEAGLVLAQRRGRTVHYEPGPTWSALKDLGATG